MASSPATDGDGKESIPAILAVFEDWLFLEPSKQTHPFPSIRRDNFIGIPLSQRMSHKTKCRSLALYTSETWQISFGEASTKPQCGELVVLSWVWREDTIFNNKGWIIFPDTWKSVQKAFSLRGRSVKGQLQADDKEMNSSASFAAKPLGICFHSNLTVSWCDVLVISGWRKGKPAALNNLWGVSLLSG